MAGSEQKSSQITGATAGQKKKFIAIGVVAALGIVLIFVNPLIGGLVLGAVLFMFTRAAGDNAPCPNCDKPLRVLGKSLTCPDCKHRLAVREGRLRDVT